MSYAIFNKSKASDARESSVLKGWSKQSEWVYHWHVIFFAFKEPEEDLC